MTEEEIAKLSPEERERMGRAEQAALEILNRRMREDRRTPRRHMQFVFLVIVALFAVALLVSLVGSWLSS